MKVLVACEFSGVVRDAFTAEGHDAWSCDIRESEAEGRHIVGDVLEVLGEGWDLMVAHPPCTFLCVTGNRWFLPEYRERFPNREQDRKAAVAFFMALMNAPIPRVAVENPVGIMSRLYRPPDQYVHPYYFGDPESKRTGLWLRGLPPLVATESVKPVMRIGSDGSRYPRWHYDSIGLDKDERDRERCRTFPGLARAMARQWGGVRCGALF